MERIKNILKSPKFVIVFGSIIRTLYVLFTKVVENRQYDIGSVPPDKEALSGHLGYIFYLYQNKALPNFDPRTVYQYFHPPVHHILEASWIAVCSLFTKDELALIECLQIPTLVYSVLILIVAYGILKELKLSEISSCVVLGIIAFHPSFIFMAGSINNDGLMFLFMFLTMYTTIRWYNKRNMLNIILIAFSIGLGMLTKLSAGLLAVSTAFVFLYVLIESIKKKDWLRIVLQYVIFGIVCVPIGLCWEIRCYLKFDMPLNYAYELSKDSWQYVGDHTLMEIFFIPNPITLFSNLIHGSLGMGENMWVQMFRTSALGECDLSMFPLWGKLVAMANILTGLIVAMIAFVAFAKMIYDCIRKKSDIFDFAMVAYLLISYLALVAFYLSFIYGYRFECTMNFRYILPTVFLPALPLGLYTGENKKMHLPIGIILFGYALMSCLNVLVWCV